MVRVESGRHHLRCAILLRLRVYQLVQRLIKEVPLLQTVCSDAWASLDHIPSIAQVKKVPRPLRLHTRNPFVPPPLLHNDPCYAFPFWGFSHFRLVTSDTLFHSVSLLSRKDERESFAVLFVFTRSVANVHACRFRVVLSHLRTMRQ